MQGHNGLQVTTVVLKCKFGSTKKVWNSLAYDAIVVLDPTNPKWIVSGITHWEGGSHDSWHVICVLMESAIPQQLCFEPGVINQQRCRRPGTRPLDFNNGKRVTAVPSLYDSPVHMTNWMYGTADDFYDILIEGHATMM